MFSTYNNKTIVNIKSENQIKKEAFTVINDLINVLDKKANKN